jgi:hypothetical protein
VSGTGGATAASTFPATAPEPVDRCARQAALAEHGRLALRGKAAYNNAVLVYSDKRGSIIMKNVMLVVATCVFITGTARASEECLTYEPQVVVLEGKVVTRTFFGPPGYGETPKIDTREKQALLLLKSKICIAEGSDENQPAEINQSKITLVPTSIKSFTPYTGKRVTVKGEIFHAISGHHHTPILMSVQTIENQGK